MKEVSHLELQDELAKVFDKHGVRIERLEYDVVEFVCDPQNRQNVYDIGRATYTWKSANNWDDE